MTDKNTVYRFEVEIAATAYITASSPEAARALFSEKLRGTAIDLAVDCVDGRPLRELAAGPIAATLSPVGTIKGPAKDDVAEDLTDEIGLVEEA